MATFTIRNVPEEIKKAWRVKAAESGHSIEEALRQLVSDQVKGDKQPTSHIDAQEIMRRAGELADDEPRDNRFKYYTQKELSDAISGEYEGI